MTVSITIPSLIALAIQGMPGRGATHIAAPLSHNWPFPQSIQLGIDLQSMDKSDDDETTAQWNLHRRLMAWQLFLPELGTLWRVREDVWIENANCQYDVRSTRKWHPGLSFGLSPEQLQCGMAVPMAHGTSGRHGPIVVRGITARQGPDYATSFGSVIAPIDLLDFGSAPEKRDKNLLTGEWWEFSRVSVNWDKRKLTALEQAALEKNLPPWLAAPCS